MNIDKNWNLPSYLHLVYIYIVSEYMYIYIYCKCNNQILQQYIYPPIYLLIYLLIDLSVYLPIYLSLYLANWCRNRLPVLQQLSVSCSNCQSVGVSFADAVWCICTCPEATKLWKNVFFWKALVVFHSHVWTAVRIRNQRHPLDEIWTYVKKQSCYLYKI